MAMERENLDALVVCGSEYTGFEGAVRYVSDFEIVHRYVYVLIPLDGDPPHLPARGALDRRQEKTLVKDHVWADLPGHWLRTRQAAKIGSGWAFTV